MSIWDKLRERAEEYAAEQMHDLRKFVTIAITLDPDLLSERGIKRVLRKGIEFCVEHGTPTKAKVKKALGL